ncbi:spore coat associated protein CotJA [Sinanaerobacter sp. ZZT-01]|uniref:spore coat associated protein CotJA n=1 Tax=Sinanaerobacter sp. ZZT-01 TaxID=3111540 RepID=UPI002D79D5BD|nr:spore coat associated protein CotJA [Sinanaerobacter sp. ZZT-01]WRR94160.1 spore coat associated protein CotJA [Sinanaerobacter sp. ZZT-01]
MDDFALKFGEITLDHNFPNPVFKTVNGNLPLDQLPLAMAYVPMQMWNGTYEGMRALERGTIFPDLDLPFSGIGVK